VSGASIWRDNQRRKRLSHFKVANAFPSRFQTYVAGPLAREKSNAPRGRLISRQKRQSNRSPMAIGIKTTLSLPGALSFLKVLKKGNAEPLFSSLSGRPRERGGTGSENHSPRTWLWAFADFGSPLRRDIWAGSLKSVRQK